MKNTPAAQRKSTSLKRKASNHLKRTSKRIAYLISNTTVLHPSWRKDLVDQENLVVCESQHIPGERGLKTAVDIKKGKFICLYAGKILDSSRPHIEPDNQEHYIFKLNDREEIDAWDRNIMAMTPAQLNALEQLNQAGRGEKGFWDSGPSKAAFVNNPPYQMHNLSFNNTMINITPKRMRLQNKEFIGFHASRKIDKGEELFVHYGENYQLQLKEHIHRSLFQFQNGDVITATAAFSVTQPDLSTNAWNKLFLIENDTPDERGNIQVKWLYNNGLTPLSINMPMNINTVTLDNFSVSTSLPDYLQFQHTINFPTTLDPHLQYCIRLRLDQEYTSADKDTWQGHGLITSIAPLRWDWYYVNRIPNQSSVQYEIQKNEKIAGNDYGYGGFSKNEFELCLSQKDNLEIDFETNTINMTYTLYKTNESKKFGLSIQDRTNSILPSSSQHPAIKCFSIIEINHQTLKKNTLLDCSLHFKEEITVATLKLTQTTDPITWLTMARDANFPLATQYLKQHPEVIPPPLETPPIPTPPTPLSHPLSKKSGQPNPEAETASTTLQYKCQDFNIIGSTIYLQLHLTKNPSTQSFNLTLNRSSNPQNPNLYIEKSPLTFLNHFRLTSAASINLKQKARNQDTLNALREKIQQESSLIIKLEMHSINPYLWLLRASQCGFKPALTELRKRNLSSPYPNSLFDLHRKASQKSGANLSQNSNPSLSL